jgi:hypothetical protein
MKRIRIDINEWEAKLGRLILVEFISILSGTNRILALGDLMLQSQIYDKEGKDGRASRNRFVAFILTIGVLHELYQLLQSFCGSVKTKSLGVHKHIISILKLFNESPLQVLIKECRDSLSFHSVSEKVLVEGLNEKRVDLVDFIDFGSDKLGDLYFRISDDASIVGLFKKHHSNSQVENFDEYYRAKLKEFMEYTAKLMKELVIEVDALVDILITEFNLNIKESS